MTQYDYQDKVVFITGAGSGLGREAAIAFARSGAKLVISDVNLDTVQETANDIQGDVLAIKCDVSSKQDVQAAIEQTMQKFGRLDVAINNAGVVHKPMPMMQCDEDTLDFVHNINVKGVFLCMQAQLPVMIKQNGGVILNVSSVAGLIGSALLAPYAASKHAVIGLTKTAAVEYVRHNIRINAICPAFTQTPMVEYSFEDQEHAHLKDRMTDAVPMRRFAKPAEIIDGMLWICSEGNGFMTGQAVTFDGGLTAQ